MDLIMSWLSTLPRERYKIQTIAYDDGWSFVTSLRLKVGGKWLAPFTIGESELDPDRGGIVPRETIPLEKLVAVCQAIGLNSGGVSNSGGPPVDLKVKDIAEVCGVNQNKVLSWIREGHLEAYNVANRGAVRWRISPEAFAGFKKKRCNVVDRDPPRRRYRPGPDVKEFV